jgi:F-type H+-transporting ATPase subunit delta
VNVASEKAHETGLAGRYANAVFELAEEEQAVDRVAADFATLETLIETTPDFARLVRSPLISRDEQARALKPVLALIGVSVLTTRFLLLLAHKRRLSALTAIIASYNRLVARLKGEVEAEITSARVLSAAETEQLKAVLKARLGREPRLHAKTDPTLLGGLVVKVGSRMIDSSIRTKLAGIRAAMRGN